MAHELARRSVLFAQWRDVDLVLSSNLTIKVRLSDFTQACRLSSCRIQYVTSNVRTINPYNGTLMRHVTHVMLEAVSV